MTLDEVSELKRIIGPFSSEIGQEKEDSMPSGN
jgi:hypothetical protein